MKFSDLSPTQQRVMRYLAQSVTEIQVAGKGRAPFLSAANALRRKGFATSYRTGWFKLTDEGRAILATATA